MNPYITFGMVLGRLLDALQSAHLRQHFNQQARLIQQSKTTTRMAFRKHLVEFVANAFAAHLMNFVRQLANRRHRTRPELVLKAGSKSHAAHHAAPSFTEAPARM